MSVWYKSAALLEKRMVYIGNIRAFFLGSCRQIRPRGDSTVQWSAGRADVTCFRAYSVKDNLSTITCFVSPATDVSRHGALSMIF